MMPSSIHVFESLSIGSTYWGVFGDRLILVKKVAEYYPNKTRYIMPLYSFKPKTQDKRRNDIGLERTLKYLKQTNQR